jgi:hypothetical protein
MQRTFGTALAYSILMGMMAGIRPTAWRRKLEECLDHRAGELAHLTPTMGLLHDVLEWRRSEGERRPVGLDEDPDKIVF